MKFSCRSNKADLSTIKGYKPQAVIICMGVLITIASGAYFPAPASAGGDVNVNCRDAALALATLNIAVGLSDKSDLDDSLQEGDIADGINELQDNFESLVDDVKDECNPNGILNGLNFEPGS
jgi:hypothetical protein